MPKVSIPDDFICPITHEIMKDPVATSDGQVYEREAIEAWLTQHDSSPITNKELPDKKLLPIPFVKKQIQGFLEKICTQEEFLQAIKNNDASSIEKLNYTHTHLEAKDKDGFTPIERAVYYGNENMLKFLKACKELKEGYVSEHDIYKYSRYDDDDDYGSGSYVNPLILAAKNGYEKVVSLLLKENKYVQESRDASKPTPLHVAVEHGHIEVVKVFLDSGIDPNLSYNQYNNSQFNNIYPIHLAAKHGHVLIIEMLTKVGANIEAIHNLEFDNYKDGKCEKTHIQQGGTAMIEAIYGNHIDCVRYLIKAGANLEAQVSFNNYKYSYDPDKKIEDRNDYICTPIGIATALGRLEIVKLLINAGAELNNNLEPPLHIAAKKGQLDLIKVLLEGGGSPKLANKYGKKPTQIALESNQPKVAEFITTYYQELKRKRNRAPNEVEELKQIIQKQQEAINKLTEQVQTLMLQQLQPGSILNSNQANNINQHLLLGSQLPTFSLTPNNDNDDYPKKFFNK